MVATKGTSRRFGRVWRALQVLLGIATGLALTEAIFWWRDHGAFPHINCYVPDARLGVRLRPGTTEKISFGGNPVTTVRINSSGFRGPELPPPGPGEILVVGDSEVFGLGVQESQPFTERLAHITGKTVINAGVPTWGPPEYEAILRELLNKRRPKTVVYVVNFAKDPFEAERPDRERYAVWDGWAVRKETAPKSVLHFPGRKLLFNRSHAVLALRRWLYERGPRIGRRSFASEGTWKDLVRIGEVHEKNQRFARKETAESARLTEVKAAFAERAALAADLHVKFLAYKDLRVSAEQDQVYLASDANPGDIVVPGEGEFGRPLAATVKYINEAVKLRRLLDDKLKELAASQPDAAESKEIVRSIHEREKLAQARVQARAGSLHLLRAHFPLLDAVRRAQKLVEAHGARFVLLVLPIDVQVSAAEWKKYGAKPLDMAPTRALLHDLIEGTRALGVTAVDATDALAKAEPGAFLKHDLHLSPKGHRAVARLLARALAAPSPLPRPPPRLALPAGRSRLPPPEVWNQIGEIAVGRSDPAGCVTKLVREWMYVRCHPKKHQPGVPTGLHVDRGGHGEVLWNAFDGAVTMIAPIVRGDEFRATFTWTDHTQVLRVSWPTNAPTADRTFEKPVPGGVAAPRPTPAAEKICACDKKLEHATSCAGLAAEPDADCVRTYGGDCAELLACAEGRLAHPPTCLPGSVNAGAALHCYPLCRGNQCAAGSCHDKQGVRLCLAPADPGHEGAPVAPPDTAQVSAPQPPAAAAVARFDTTALGAMRAALTALDGCGIDEQYTDVGRYKVYESCKYKPAALHALRDSVEKVSALVHSQPALGYGPRRAVSTELELFSRWLDLSARTHETRGTLALYQKVASAWNAYRPAQRVPTDPPRFVHEYTVHMPDRWYNYLARSYHSYAARRKLGLPLPWKPGLHGPWLPDMYSEK